MKYRYLLLVLMVFILYACHKPAIKEKPDVPAESGVNYKTNSWVYSKFEDRYLWAGNLEDVTAQDKRNLAPNVLFDERIRFRKNNNIALEKDYYGDRFSKVVKTSPTTRSVFLDYERKTLGFGFTVISITDAVVRDKILYNMITSVTPGSPADRAGLVRGDCFYQINDHDLGVFKGSAATDYYQVIARENSIRLDFFYPHNRRVSLNRTIYDNNPIIVDSIYNFEGESLKTGYLVYDSFNSGWDGKTEAFNEKLKEVFTRYAKEGVESVIVDLRYNGGGEVKTARYLTSLLADKSFLGKTFAYLEEKKSFGKPDLYFDYKLMGENDKMLSGAKPNLEKIYFLTSEYTASASEMVIHTLRALMPDKILTLGYSSHTLGKNVGGITVKDDKYDWEMTIMTLRVYDSNSNPKSDYEEGLRVDVYGINDMLYLDTRMLGIDKKIYPYSELMCYAQYGDVEKEPLLRHTMSLIYPRLFSAPRRDEFTRSGEVGVVPKMQDLPAAILIDNVDREE